MVLGEHEVTAQDPKFTVLFSQYREKMQLPAWLKEHLPKDKRLNQDPPAKIKEHLDSITIPEHFLHWAIEIIHKNNAVEEENRSTMLHNQRRLFDECLKRIDNLIDLYISSDNAKRELLSEEEFKNQKRTSLCGGKQA